MQYSHEDKGFVGIKIGQESAQELSEYQQGWAITENCDNLLFEEHRSSCLMRAQLCTLVLLTAQVGSYEYQRITQVWKLFKNLWRRNPQTLLKHSDTTFGPLSLLMKLGGLCWEILMAYLPSFNPLALSVGIGYYQRQVIRKVAYL